MAKKRPITCKRCKAGGLAWKQEDGNWVLYVGVHNGTSWEASDTRHACSAPPPPAPAPARDGTARAPGPDLNAIRCACGVTLWVDPVEILRVGYPVCSGCQTFFEAHAA